MSAPAPGSNATDGKSMEELKREWHAAEKQTLKSYSAGTTSDARRAVANGRCRPAPRVIPLGSSFTLSRMLLGCLFVCIRIIIPLV